MFAENNEAKTPDPLRSAHSTTLRNNELQKSEFIDVAPETDHRGSRGWPVVVISPSVRKYLAEYAANFGAMVTKVESSGRLKSQKGGDIVFGYIKFSKHLKIPNSIILPSRGCQVQAQKWVRGN